MGRGDRRGREAPPGERAGEGVAVGACRSERRAVAAGGVLAAARAMSHVHVTEIVCVTIIVASSRGCASWTRSVRPRFGAAGPASAFVRSATLRSAHHDISF